VDSPIGERAPGRRHILVSTTAATNVIADTLVARQELIPQAPAVQDLVAGWSDGISVMQRTRMAPTAGSWRASWGRRIRDASG
jgi:hypothetical protein